MAAWFHGSPLRLMVLSAGSTITRDRTVARIFSHKPTLVAHDEQGQIFHNGRLPGFLYTVEDVADEDVFPHPETTMAPDVEWLTRRDLTLVFVEETTVQEHEKLDEVEERTLWKQRGAVG